MKKVILISSHCRDVAKTNVEKKCCDFFHSRHPEADIHIFYSGIKTDIPYATYHKKTDTTTISGYKMMWEFLYESDNDYAIMLDNDVTIRDFFDVRFETVFEMCIAKVDIMTISANWMTKNVENYIGRKKSFCSRIYCMKNLRKKGLRELYLIDTPYVAGPDVDFGLDLLINQKALIYEYKGSRQVLLDNVGIIDRTKGDGALLYRKEKIEIHKKYNLPPPKFKKKI